MPLHHPGANAPGWSSIRIAEFTAAPVRPRLMAVVCLPPSDGPRKAVGILGHTRRNRTPGPGCGGWIGSPTRSARVGDGRMDAAGPDGLARRITERRGHHLLGGWMVRTAAAAVVGDAAARPKTKATHGMIATTRSGDGPPECRGIGVACSVTPRRPWDLDTRGVARLPLGMQYPLSCTNRRSLHGCARI